LILTRDAERPPLQVVKALVASGLDACAVPLVPCHDELQRAFRGVPPDLLVADLSEGVEFFVVRQAQARIIEVWGDGLPPPPCIGLLTRRHLALAELRTNLDDFLLAPYEPEELKARVALLLFRLRQVETGDTLSFINIRMNLTNSRVLGPDNKSLKLTPREFELLRFLLTHRGRGFTRMQLLSSVWGMDYEGGERTVDIHIRRLRAKLPEETAAFLETRRGFGYGFRVD
jgi:hypothetical protein